MSEKINLVAQSYGPENEYRRTILSIWSFYAHVSAKFTDTKTLLFTDNPGFFKTHLRDLPVTFVLLTPERIKQMRGEINFLHRIKICIIEEAFQRCEGDLLYMDGDTFFTKDPSQLFGRITEKVSFMHSNEYVFHTLREMPLPSGATFHSVLKHMEENEFTMADGHRQRFLPTLFSWNAGALMLHRMHQPLLADVYAITDQLYVSTRNHASEQYAFSIILQTHTELEACEKVIYHYWYRIKKLIADDFLKRKINLSWPGLRREEKKDLVSKWTEFLPGYFESHLLAFRDNAIQAFNRNEFGKGYSWAGRALVRNPFNISFIRDVAYHTWRFLLKK